MTNEQHPENRQDRTSISSTEYRTKLLTKLNCLMAVLEVAITKITRSMDLPSANQERLTKIRANLENTLSICTRAKTTLEKSMNVQRPGAPKRLTGGETAENRPSQNRPAAPQEGAKDSMSYRDYVELSSIEEYQKFKALPPIDEDELSSTDIDDLLKKLYES